MTPSGRFFGAGSASYTAVPISPSDRTLLVMHLLHGHFMNGARKSSIAPVRKIRKAVAE
jgi:hypothetical protein